jgi:hypothetical protein
VHRERRDKDNFEGIGGRTLVLKKCISANSAVSSEAGERKNIFLTECPENTEQASKRFIGHSLISGAK